jgi:hypothetical protein
MAEVHPASESEEEEIEAAPVKAALGGRELGDTEITEPLRIGTCKHSDRNGHRRSSRDRRYHSKDRHRSPRRHRDDRDHRDTHRTHYKRRTPSSSSSSSSSSDYSSDGSSSVSSSTRKRRTTPHFKFKIG